MHVSLLFRIGCKRFEMDKVVDGDVGEKWSVFETGSKQQKKNSGFVPDSCFGVSSMWMLDVTHEIPQFWSSLGCIVESLEANGMCIVGRVCSVYVVKKGSLG